MALKIDPVTEERVYELMCVEDGCVTVGGTITFAKEHGRESDAALEAELDAKYTHTCDDHK